MKHDKLIIMLLYTVDKKNEIIYADPNVSVKKSEIGEFIKNFSGELILIKK